MLARGWRADGGDLLVPGLARVPVVLAVFEEP
jgi:hypothetical protein